MSSVPDSREAGRAHWHIDNFDNQLQTSGPERVNVWVITTLLLFIHISTMFVSQRHQRENLAEESASIRDNSSDLLASQPDSARATSRPSPVCDTTQSSGEERFKATYALTPGKQRRVHFSEPASSAVRTTTSARCVYYDTS